MNQTIEGCHDTIGRLEIRWAERDRTARTARTGLINFGEGWVIRHIQMEIDSARMMGGAIPNLIFRAFKI